MFKRFATLAVVAAMTLAMPFLADAAQIGTLTIDPSTATPGQTVTISGSCGDAGANSTLVGVSAMYSDTTTTLTVAVGSSLATDATGAFSTMVTVPSGLTAPMLSLAALCPNGVDTVNGDLVLSVPEGGVEAGAGGMTNLWMFTGAALLLALGATGIVMSQRRKTEDDGK